MIAPRIWKYHEVIMSDRLKSGPDGFRAIHDEFRGRIHRYLCRMVGEAEAEDLTQEVFIKVDKALPAFRDESSVSTWLYRIATNAAHDHMRSASSRHESLHAELSDMDDAMASEGYGGGALHLDAALIRKDMNDCIRGIVDSLPEPYRTSLVLCDIEGLTNAEVAEVTGISLDSVKIRLHRARTKLRIEMEKKCVFYRDSRNELACDRKPVKLNLSVK